MTFRYGISVKSESTDIVVKSNSVVGVKMLTTISLKDSTAGFDFF